MSTDSVEWREVSRNSRDSESQLTSGGLLMRFSNRHGTWGAIATCVGLAATGAFAQISAVLPAGNIVLKNVQGVAKFDGAGVAGPSGAPALPKYTLTFLLPPNTDPKTVSVSLEGLAEETVSGAVDVSPVPPLSTMGKDYWPAGASIVNGRDQNIYGRNAFYPASHLGDKRFGKLGAYQLLEVDVREYLYNPAAKTLRRAVSGNVVVKVGASVASVAAAAPAVAPRYADQIRSLAVNYGSAIGAYGVAKAAATTAAAASGTTYLVLTTDEILRASLNLGAFADAKVAAGFKVELATGTTSLVRQAGAWVCQIPSSCTGGWGGGTGDAAAENLRTYLKANYVSHNVEYALLVGNPNPTTGDVPMKMMWPRYTEVDYRESPTDFYYADLTGNWDLNGNGIYGQETVDEGPGGIDKYSEISVGRIPFYGVVADLDKILAKSVRYQKETDISWRANVLASMRTLWEPTPEYYVGEYIKTNLTTPRGWGIYRIYDSLYGTDPEMTPTRLENVLNAWKTQAFGLHVWQTHGWAQGGSDIFESSYATQLDDLHPSFTFQGSCSTSEPEPADNLSYSLLKNGGIGTIGATRVSWSYGGVSNFVNNDDGSLANLVRKYSEYLIRDTLTAGKALAQLRATTNGWLMNMEDFNLYGDPSLSLGNPSPKAPAAVTGIVASAGNQLVTLSWNAASGASGYSVKRSASATGPFAVVATGVRAASYADAGLVNGTTYFYVVSASNGGGESPNSAVVSATPKAPTSGLRVQYRNGDAAAADNQIKPFFQVVNTGAKTESLAGVKIRYWFTNDNNSALQATCDWCQIGSANLAFSTGTLVPAVATADRYLDVVFASTAGTLAPGASTGEMQTRLNHADWTNFNEVGDYSYDATRVSYGANDKICLYGASGELVAGVEPGVSVPPPAAPSLFDATAGNGKASLVWSKVSNATGYNVYRGVLGQVLSKLSTVTDTFYVDAAAANGTTYSYNVKAVNASGEGAASVSDTATPYALPQVPASPSIVAAVAGDASAKITWTKVASATSYTLKFSKAVGDTIAVAGLSDTSYTKTSLVNGTTYAVVVSATNAVGQGANSAAVSVTPAGLSVPSAPTGLKAVASDKRVQLSWNYSAGATEYVVERSDAANAFAVLATVTVPAYVDLAVTNGTTYSYRVRAKNAAGSSAASDVATAKPEGSVEPCSPATDMTGGQSGNFNTTGSVCKRTSANIAGWGCSNLTGRTVKVNGVAVACGAALPAKTATGYYYFDVSAGAYSWASLYWW